MATCDDLLKSFASALPTKKPQKAWAWEAVVRIAAAEGAVRDHAADSDHPEEEESALAPLRRGAPGVRGDEHGGGDAEVGGVEEMAAADADRELGGDGKGGGERGDPPDVAAEEEGQTAGGDDGGEDAYVAEAEDFDAGELGAEGGSEEERRVPDVEVSRREADRQERREKGDLQVARIARGGGDGSRCPCARHGHDRTNASVPNSICGLYGARTAAPRMRPSRSAASASLACASG